MNKLQSFLSFFIISIMSIFGGIKVASIDYSGFEDRLGKLAYQTNKDYKIPDAGHVAGVSTSSNIIPAGAEYAMLISVVSAASAPTCTSLLVDTNSGVAPFDVKFTGSGLGDSLSYKFVFGDGEQVTTLDSQINHTYLKSGTYTATLKVISNKIESNNSDSCKVVINVMDKLSGQQSVPLVSEASHLVCRNLACVRVSGEGENECSSNTDCLSTTVPVTSASDEGKPLVPVTGGGSQLAMYLVVALGFISAGLIFLIFV